MRLDCVVCSWLQCVNTFDKHDDRVWALAVRQARDGSGDVEMVTGGSDSVLNVWADVTAEEAEEAMLESEAKLLKQQELYNAMARRDYAKVRRANGRRCDVH